MSVKKITYLTSPFSGHDQSKANKFAKDVLEIIENKIEYSEILEMPYADSTANQDLGYRARRACRDYIWTKYGKSPSTTDFFIFAKRKSDDGYHWYCKFNVEAYERMVKQLVHD